MQASSNFWQTVKGQQILQLSVCAIVSLGCNIYWGIIEFNRASVNFQSTMYFCGTLFILVVLVSLVTAPFHLDREREEAIQEKQAEINKLQITVTPSKIIASTQKPKKAPNIKCKKVYSTKVDMYETYEFDYNSEGQDALILLDFVYERTDNSYETVEVRAEININNLEQEFPALKITGKWYREENQFQTFIPDDIGTVIVGLTYEKQLFFLEHQKQNTMQLMGAPPIKPKFHPMEGNNFAIKVRLIGNNPEGVVINKPFNFKLSLNPAIKFEIDKGETI